MKFDRICRMALAIAAATGATPHLARAQAGPVALLLPASAQTASQGNAGVALTDDYAIFANPALIAPAAGFGVTLATYSADTRSVAFASGATVGPVTFGWGVHLVDFSTTSAPASYPFVPAALTATGDADGTSTLAVIGGQSTFRRFRIGLAAKYASDIAPRTEAANPLIVTAARGAAFLADVGVTHALWTGTAGLAVQNIGQPYRMGDARYPVPTQATLGWTVGHEWGPLDLSYATQVLARRGGWVSPAGGVEVGWSWIEGYNIAGRVGARRPETDAERPLEFGASFTADRLSLDYGVVLYSGNSAAHFVSLRWR